MLKLVRLSVLAGSGFLVAAGAAQAADYPKPSIPAGCNDHVNQLQWGCAAWDHNWGPQYPNWNPNWKQNPKYGWVKPAPAPVHVQPKPQAPPPSAFTHGSGQATGGGRIMGNSGGDVIGSNGSGAISNNGSSAISNNGSAMRRP